MKRKPSLVPVSKGKVAAQPQGLLTELRELIVSTRQTVARSVNAALVILYWKIGERIHRDILQEKRASYGEEILPTLSAKLVPEFGEGFGVRNLARMVGLAEAFPDARMVATLSQQLGGSHFVELLPLRKPLQRDFYAEMCRLERWSVRALRAKIGGMLYEPSPSRAAPRSWRREASAWLSISPSSRRKKSWSGNSTKPFGSPTRGWRGTPRGHERTSLR